MMTARQEKHILLIALSLQKRIELRKDYVTADKWHNRLSERYETERSHFFLKDWPTDTGSYDMATSI